MLFGIISFAIYCPPCHLFVRPKIVYKSARVNIFLCCPRQVPAKAYICNRDQSNIHEIFSAEITHRRMKKFYVKAKRFIL